MTVSLEPRPSCQGTPNDASGSHCPCSSSRFWKRRFMGSSRPGAESIESIEPGGACHVLPRRHVMSRARPVWMTPTTRFLAVHRVVVVVCSSSFTPRLHLSLSLSLSLSCSVSPAFYLSLKRQSPRLFVEPDAVDLQRTKRAGSANSLSYSRLKPVRPAVAHLI